MDQKFSVSTADTVSVFISTSYEENCMPIEKRFDKSLPIKDLKNKLELVIGASSNTLKIKVYNKDDKFLFEIDEDERLLGSYPVDSGMRLHIEDAFLLKKMFSDESNVEKFDLTVEQYEKRDGVSMPTMSSGTRGRGRSILKDNMERLHSVERRKLRRPKQELVSRIQQGESSLGQSGSWSSTSSNVSENNSGISASEDATCIESDSLQRLHSSKEKLLRRPGKELAGKLLESDAGSETSNKWSDTASTVSSNDEISARSDLVISVTENVKCVESKSDIDEKVESGKLKLNPNAQEFVPRQMFTGLDVSNNDEGKCIIPIIDPKTGRPIDLGSCDSTSKSPNDWQMDYDDDEFEFKVDQVINAVSLQTISCQPYGDIKYEKEVQDLLDLIHQQLSRNPGLYLNVMKAMEKIVLRWCGFSTTLQLVSKTLVEQGMEKNYAYLAARMCTQVDKLSASLGLIPSFRTCVLNVCQEKHALLESMLEKKDYKSAYGIITFFAELFVQLTVKDQTRIEKLGLAVMESLNCLLENPKEPNVGCVCKILKLCGWALDSDFKQFMRQLLSKLVTVTYSQKFDDLTMSMIKGVKSLADQQWGRSSPVPLSPPHNSATREFVENGAKHVNGAGDSVPNNFTKDEFKFFNDNLKVTLDDLGLSTIDSDLDDEASDMDEEAFEAYEEFLSTMPNSKHKRNS